MDFKPQLQKYLLRQIVSQGVVTAETPHQVAYPGLPSPHQLFECAGIASAC